MGKIVKLHGDEFQLPTADNSPETLKILRAANERFREVPRPAPYDKTRHELRLGDARDLDGIPDASVQLVVTTSPYWTLKQYEGSCGQLGDLNIGPIYDELIILPFVATNQPPHAFGWAKSESMLNEYGAALIRISQTYDQRFS